MFTRIRIKMRKVYFHGKHVDLVWYGRKGIKMRMKGDFGSFLWTNGDIMILNWMWLRGRSVYMRH
jgi:hypothetical protein